jgi:hypothetical protein
MLTKNDIHAIRHADTLCVHLTKEQPGLVRLIKRKGYNAKPFETDQEYVLENVAVGMETARGKAALDSGTAKCFAHAYMYHEQGCPVSSIMRTLRVGDEVTFSFYPDAHSNGYVAECNLHADVLYLHVLRGGKRHTWELQTSVCRDNSARMCRGVPKTDDYRRAAEEARKIA